MPGQQRVDPAFGGGGGGAMVLVCLPLAAPIGLLPLLILTLCGPEHVLVVSTEPLHDLSYLTTLGVGRPRDGLVPVPLTRCIQMHTTATILELPSPPPPGPPFGANFWSGEPRRTPSPCGVCRLQHCLGGGGGAINAE